MNKFWVLVSATIILLFTAASTSAEENPDDAIALRSVTSGKVVWDINTASPAKLALYLGVIEETYDDLIRQGITPAMVLAFRGESLKIIGLEHDQITLTSIPEIKQSAQKIHELMLRPGVRMEACSIAARIFEVDTEKILHGIRPVGNTFVSLIGYQSKGYAIIPIY